MKLLIIQDFTDKSMVSMSNEEKLRIRQTTIDWLEKHKKSGKCMQVYWDVLGMTLVSAWNMDTQEYLQVALDCPFRDIGSAKYFPIVELEDMKTILSHLK